MPTPPGAAPRPSWRSIAIGVVQVGITVVVLGAVIVLWGAENITSALRGLPWWAFAAAFVLGGSGVLAQAARWRIVARPHGIDISFPAAVARCWQASFLNSVLPGGVAGDILRGADDSTDASASSRRGALARGFTSMAAERLIGSAVVFSAGGMVLLPLAPLAGVGCLLVALAAGAVASRWLRGLAWAALLRLLLLAVLGWSFFAGLFVVAILILAPGTPLAVMPGAAAVALAGMSLPVGVGGWGVREIAAAWSFSLNDLPAEAGIRVSVGYGVLALTSTLPGAAIFAVRVMPRLRGARQFLSQKPRKSS